MKHTQKQYNPCLLLYALECERKTKKCTKSHKGVLFFHTALALEKERFQNGPPSRLSAGSIHPSSLRLSRRLS